MLILNSCCSLIGWFPNEGTARRCTLSGLFLGAVKISTVSTQLNVCPQSAVMLNLRSDCLLAACLLTMGTALHCTHLRHFGCSGLSLRADTGVKIYLTWKLIRATLVFVPVLRNAEFKLWLILSLVFFFFFFFFFF